MTNTITNIYKINSQVGILNTSFREMFLAWKGNGIKGLFNSLSTVKDGYVTEFDIELLKRFNNLVTTGTPKLQAMEDVMFGASKSAQQLALESDNAGVKLENLKVSTNNSIIAMAGARVAAMALNMALSMGLSLALQGIVALIDEWVHKEEKEREALLETAKAAKEENNKIEELYKTYTDANEAYKNNTGSKENLKKATDDLLSALGVEYSKLDDLIEKYGDLDKAIQATTIDSLQKNLNEMISGLAAVRGEAAKTVADDTNFLYDIAGENGISWDKDDPLVKYLDELDMLTEAQKKAGIKTWFVSDGLFSDEGYEQAKRMYDDLLSMRKVLENNSGKSATELAESSYIRLACS